MNKKISEGFQKGPVEIMYKPDCECEDFYDEDPNEGDYCQCLAIHDEEELASNRCSCCGGIVEV